LVVKINQNTYKASERVKFTDDGAAGVFDPTPLPRTVALSTLQIITSTLLLAPLRTDGLAHPAVSPR
jgi:hypothetical protein